MRWPAGLKLNDNLVRGLGTWSIRFIEVWSGSAAAQVFKILLISVRICMRLYWALYSSLLGVVELLRHPSFNRE